MNQRAYFDILVRHETTLWNAVEKRMRGEDSVSLARLEVLRAIAAHSEGARVQDVADAVGTTIAAASRLLDRLVTDGLVSRSPDPADRRSVRMVLTTDGSAAHSATGARFDEALRSILDTVHPDVLATLATGLHAVQTEMESER